MEVRTVSFGKASKTWYLYFAREDGTWTRQRVSKDKALRVYHLLKEKTGWHEKHEDDLSARWTFVSRKR